MFSGLKNWTPLFFLIFFLIAHSMPVFSAGSEPSFSEVIAQVIRQERLELKSVEKLENKIKKAAWLPTLSVGYDRTVRQTQSLDNSDNISVTTGGIVVGPDDVNLNQSVNQGDVLHFRAIWQLGDLVFSSSNFQVFRERRELSNDRLKMTEYVYKIYAERSQAQELLRRGIHRLKEGDSLKIKVKNLTDKLDALTGGSFVQRWQRI